LITLNRRGKMYSNILELIQHVKVETVKVRGKVDRLKVEVKELVERNDVFSLPRKSHELLIATKEWVWLRELSGELLSLYEDGGEDVTVEDGLILINNYLAPVSKRGENSVIADEVELLLLKQEANLALALVHRFKADTLLKLVA